MVKTVKVELCKDEILMLMQTLLPTKASSDGMMLIMKLKDAYAKLIA